MSPFPASKVTAPLSRPSGNSGKLPSYTARNEHAANASSTIACHALVGTAERGDFFLGSSLTQARYPCKLVNRHKDQVTQPQKSIQGKKRAAPRFGLLSP